MPGWADARLTAQISTMKPLYELMQRLDAISPVDRRDTGISSRYKKVTIALRISKTAIRFERYFWKALLRHPIPEFKYVLGVGFDAGR